MWHPSFDDLDFSFFENLRRKAGRRFPSGTGLWRGAKVHHGTHLKLAGRGYLVRLGAKDVETISV